MEKRWLILVLFLLLLSLSSVTAILETHNTTAKNLLIIDKPEVALVNSSFSIGLKYYFTNQQVREAEISFKAAGKLIDKKTYANDRSAEAKFDLIENQVASYPYTLILKEKVGEANVVETRIDFYVSVISDLVENVKTTHEMVVVSNSKQIYFDDLSIYEPFSLRDQLNYSIVQQNPTKVGCSLENSVITFTPANDFTGRTACTIAGSYSNITIKHTYSIMVMADKKLSIKNLSDVYLEDVSEGQIIYENITRFCNYEVKDKSSPYIYLISESNYFDLLIDGSDLKIFNISSAFSGKALIKLGCNDQFREFTLSVREKEFYEDEIHSERTLTGEKLDFGIGTVSIKLPETSYADENNQLEVVVELDNKDLHSFEKAILKDSDNGQEFEEKNCCDIKFDLSSKEPTKKNYLLRIYLSNKRSLDFTKNEEDYLINSSGLSFILEKPFSVEFVSRKTDPLSGVNNNLGIIKPPFGAEAEKALEAMLLKAAPGKSIAVLKQDILGTSELIEATKIIGSSTKVSENGERYNTAIIKIKIHPKDKLKNVVVYEYIPKTNAESIADIQFNNAVLESYSGSFEIIEPDPLIAWHFPKLEQDLELSYELSRETLIIGNTIIIAETAEKKGSIYPVLIIVLLVILVLIIALLVFKFRRPLLKKQNKKQKSSEPIESRIEDKLIMIEKYVEKRLSLGHKRVDVALDLVKKGWPEELVEKLIRKFEK